jgi:hypothetical protein
MDRALESDQQVVAAVGERENPTMSTVFPDELKRGNMSRMLGSLSSSRVLSGVAGGALLMMGRRRRGMTGRLMTAVGGMLMTNAAAGSRLAAFARG